MKKLAIAVLVLALPLPAMALTAKDVLSLVAMPLAVAAVSDVTNVPQDQLASLVAGLNQANVPPDQFVQLLRYTPPALIAPPPPSNPVTLVQFVQDQTSRGISGPALVTAIDQQLPVYGVTPVIAVPEVPATTLVLEPDYIPSNSVAQLGGVTDPLALIAMPLAVAAVSDLTGVPQDQLATLVASLNQADVPPAEFVQVLRYTPVALVSDNSQPFVSFVQQQTAQGVTGPALVTVINQQLPNYGLQPQPLPPPQSTVYVDGNYFPPAVTARVAEASRNPHGGPPGQLKKIYGVQTGAEIVHGEKPGRQFGGPAPMIAQQPQVQPPARVEHHHGNPHGMPPGLAKREELPPPMTSGAEPRGHVPPGQAKKMERMPVQAVPPQAMPMPAPVPQGGPPAGMPPGQAKKQGGPQGGPPAGGPPGQNKGGEGHGHGHGKD